MTYAANIAAKRILSRVDRPDDMKIMLHDAIRFIDLLCETITSRELIQPVPEPACEHNLSLYDALFVAAAVHHQAPPLFTDDKELSLAARDACRVMLLEQCP